MNHRNPSWESWALSLSLFACTSVLALLPAAALAADTKSAVPTSVDVKLPCGGTYYPDCTLTLQGNGLPPGRSQPEGTVAQAGVIPQLEGRISKMVDGIYQGKWINFIINQNTGEVVTDDSKKFAVPANPADKPGICAPLPLKLHLDPGSGKPGGVCKSDQNYVADANNNFLGESCGELAAVFPDETGSSFQSPIKAPNDPSKYFGRETSYIAGSLAVALAHHFYKVKDQLERTQTLTVTHAGCIEAAQILKQKIARLDGFKAQPVPGQSEITQDVLIHLKRGCDDQQLSSCPTQDYLQAANSQIQQGLVALAVCTINGEASESYRKFQAVAFDEILAQAMAPCVASHGGALRATQRCYQGKFVEYWKSAVAAKWPMALKGCAQ